MAAAMTAAMLCDAAVASSMPPWVYDASILEMRYDGDLTGGTLTIDDVDGRQFRVQRIGLPDVLGIGVFGDIASLRLEAEFVSYVDGVATFAGSGPGPHFLAVDEAGATLSANLDVFQLDPGDGMVPGIQGAGLLVDVTWSDDSFQTVCTEKLDTRATLFSLQFLPGFWTFEDFLSGAMGDTPISVDTLEVRVPGSGCWGDLDGDGDTDQADLGALLASYGIDAGGDLNCDGQTDQIDLGILLADYDCTP
jgi:hypothetical protein